MIILAELAHVLAWLLFGDFFLADTLPPRPFHEFASKGMGQVSASKLWELSRYSQECLGFQSDSLHPAFSNDTMNRSSQDGCQKQL